MLGPQSLGRWLITVSVQVLTEDQLTDTDEQLLELLREGRVTAPFAADAIDASQEYVRSRLKRLVEHGHARKVYTGLYELTDDPAQGGGDGSD